MYKKNRLLLERVAQVNKLIERNNPDQLNFYFFQWLQR